MQQFKILIDNFFTNNNSRAQKLNLCGPKWYTDWWIKIFLIKYFLKYLIVNIYKFDLLVSQLYEEICIWKCETVAKLKLL